MRRGVVSGHGRSMADETMDTKSVSRTAAHRQPVRHQRESSGCTTAAPVEVASNGNVPRIELHQPRESSPTASTVTETMRVTTNGKPRQAATANSDVLGMCICLHTIPLLIK